MPADGTFEHPNVPSKQRTHCPPEAPQQRGVPWPVKAGVPAPQQVAVSRSNPVPA